MDLPIWWWLLVSIGVAGIAADLWLVRYLRVAVHLNLRLHRLRHMAQIGDKFLATIAPTDASGNPAPVTNVNWSTAGGSYDVQGVGNSATIRADFAGASQTLTVTATASDGTSLTQTVPLDDVAAPVVPVAVALNLTVVPA